MCKINLLTMALYQHNIIFFVTSRTENKLQRAMSRNVQSVSTELQRPNQQLDTGKTARVNTLTKHQLIYLLPTGFINNNTACLIIIILKNNIKTNNNKCTCSYMSTADHHRKDFIICMVCQNYHIEINSTNHYYHLPIWLLISYWPVAGGQITSVCNV